MTPKKKRPAGRSRARRPAVEVPRGPFPRSAEAQSVIARLEAENRTLHEARSADQWRYQQLSETRDRNLERAAAAEGAVAELRAVVRELRMDVLYARIGVRGRRDFVPGCPADPTPARPSKVRRKRS